MSINEANKATDNFNNKLADTEAKGKKMGDSISTKMAGVSKSFENAGKVLTLGLTAPITALGGMAIKNASDLNETMNKVEVAFGNNADSVKAWGNTTIKQFGIAKGTALDMASLYGDMATGMGMNTAEASKLSTNLTGLAGDLASFKNISIDVAKTALAGVFTGETESLKQLGIIMTQTNLEQYALSQGITKSIDDMSQAELIQLRYSYVTEMSKNAVGDFARTSDSTANQQRILTETVKEQTAQLGQKLLPAYNNLLSTGLKVLDWFNGLNDEQKQTIINVAKILAVIGPALIIIGKIISAILSFSKAIKVIGAVTKAVWLFNASLLANPITWIILGIVALIAIIVLLIKYWDQVSSAVGSAFSNITTFFGNMFSAIGGFFSGIFNAITTFFTNVWTAFMGFVTPIIDFINNARSEEH